jgi:Raf kinase inhibitor-like YbhB/YbcL family protein
MKLTSPEFENNGHIPSKFTCQGEDISPALIVEGIPQDTKSLALIVDDPDAPAGTWVHWVVFNISLTDRIDEKSIPGKQGINDFGRQDYGGPCPPSGTHRYFFKIYALDTELDLKEGIDKKSLENAMEGHVLGKAELIGLYKKV